MERQHHSLNVERSGGALGLEYVIADIQDNASSGTVFLTIGSSA